MHNDCGLSPVYMLNLLILERNVRPGTLLYTAPFFLEYVGEISDIDRVPFCLHLTYGMHDVLSHLDIIIVLCRSRRSPPRHRFVCHRSPIEIYKELFVILRRRIKLVLFLLELLELGCREEMEVLSYELLHWFDRSTL